jgi:hypothetical protein
MLTFRKNGYGMTIYKSDILKLNMEEYFKDIMKLESLKNSYHNVDLTLSHYHNIPQNWYTLQDVRIFMKLLVKSKPHILYFATDESFLYILKSLLDYTIPLRDAIARNQEVEDLLNQALLYAERNGGYEEFGELILETTGYKMLLDYY